MSEAAILMRCTGAKESLEVLESVEELLEAIGQRQYRTKMNRLRARLEVGSARKLTPILKSLGEHVAGVAADQGGLLVESVATRDASQKEIARVNAIVKAADLPKWRQEHMLEWIETLYSGAWAGEYALSQPGLDDSARSKLEKSILRMGGRNLGLVDLTDHTKASLFRVLEFSREWEVGKPSPRQVGRWIQQEVPKGRFIHAGSSYRARLIARTETMNATRLAAIENAEANPRVKLLTAFDGDMDEQCALRNGNDFTPEEARIETGATHPNCTLMFVPAYTP